MTEEQEKILNEYLEFIKREMSNEEHQIIKAVNGSQNASIYYAGVMAERNREEDCPDCGGNPYKNCEGDIPCEDNPHIENCRGCKYECPTCNGTGFDKDEDFQDELSKCLECDSDNTIVNRVCFNCDTETTIETGKDRGINKEMIEMLKKCIPPGWDLCKRSEYIKFSKERIMKMENIIARAEQEGV